MFSNSDGSASILSSFPKIQKISSFLGLESLFDSKTVKPSASVNSDSNDNNVNIGKNLIQNNVVSSEKSSVTSPLSSTSFLPNFTQFMTRPIQYEEFSKEYNQLATHDSYDGLRVEAGKIVTKQLQANHTLLLGTSLSEKNYIYQFGPTFTSIDGSLLLIGRYSNDGLMNFRAMKKFSDTFETKLSVNSSLNSVMNTMMNYSTADISFEKTYQNWASSIKAAWQGTWLLQTTFSQLISPRLMIGSDLTWIMLNNVTIGSVGLRYQHGKNVFSGFVVRQPCFKSKTISNMNNHSLKLQCFSKVSNKLSLGSELELGNDDSSLMSSLRFGYEYLFSQARIQGLIDTMGKISVIIQDSTGIGVSGQLDYWRNDYKFGLLLHLMPQQSQEKSIKDTSI